MKLYKVLNADRTVCHNGTGTWPEPGTWLRVGCELIPCERGLHLCEARDLIRWIGPTLWEVELDPSGDAVRHDDSKWAVSGARLVRRIEKWNDRNLRNFACDCAERALMRERWAGREPAPASREAVRVARRYADGLANNLDLAAAAEALEAAGAAAGAAERDWQSRRIIELCVD
jgi:hypothetical protein